MTTPTDEPAKVPPSKLDAVQADARPVVGFALSVIIFCILAPFAGDILLHNPQVGARAPLLIGCAWVSSLAGAFHWCIKLLKQIGWLD